MFSVCAKYLIFPQIYYLMHTAQSRP